MKFYLSIETKGNKIYERYIEDGTEKEKYTTYQPTLFTNTNEETKFTDIYGKYCKPKKFDTMSEARDWMRNTKDMVDVLGMDDYRLAYIADNYTDVQYDPKYIRVCNFDIEVTGNEFPKPSEAKFEIDAITHYDSVDDKFYVFDVLNTKFAKVTEWCIKRAGMSEEEGGDNIPQHVLDKVVYMSFDNEKDMLLNYINLYVEKPPTILTGWNIEKFDIVYLFNRVKFLFGDKFINKFSPINRVTNRVTKDSYGNEIEVYSISGVSVLDYIDLYKKFSFTNQPSYTLDYVAEYETGVGKLPYEGPIHKLRETQHQRYISYNIIDVDRVLSIDKKRAFIELAISMAYYGNMPFSYIMSPVLSWDAIIFNSLKKLNKVVPENKAAVKEKYPGAFVKDPKPGSYPYLISMDLESLYPRIIQQVGISPETIVDSFNVGMMRDYIDKRAPRPSELYSCSPNGWMYRKDIEGIVPIEVGKVFIQRKEWKAKMKTAERNVESIKHILAERNK